MKFFKLDNGDFSELDRYCGRSLSVSEKWRRNLCSLRGLRMIHASKNGIRYAKAFTELSVWTRRRSGICIRHVDQEGVKGLGIADTELDSLELVCFGKEKRRRPPFFLLRETCQESYLRLSTCAGHMFLFEVMNKGFMNSIVPFFSSFALREKLQVRDGEYESFMFPSTID